MHTSVGMRGTGKQAPPHNLAHMHTHHCFAQVDIRVFANMPEANETTEGSVPNYVGLMTWLHDHMTMKGGSIARDGHSCCHHAAQRQPSAGPDTRTSASLLRLTPACAFPASSSPGCRPPVRS